jgi:hypothetical protein
LIKRKRAACIAVGRHLGVQGPLVMAEYTSKVRDKSFTKFSRRGFVRDNIYCIVNRIHLQAGEKAGGLK